VDEITQKEGRESKEKAADQSWENPVSSIFSV
jgi:hypothetical protein